MREDGLFGTVCKNRNVENVRKVVDRDKFDDFNNQKANL